MRVFAERGRPDGDGYSVKVEFRDDGVTSSLTRNPQLNMLVDSGERTEYRNDWTRGELNGMKVNSFFSGGGGFDLGFIQAGFEIAGAWDFDKYAVESYKHNLGDHVKQMSVLDMTGEDVPQANGWLFGFPCQDISVAGKQAGMVKGETRSGLFYEIMRLLGEVKDKPEWILAENVKAVNKFIPTIREEYEKAGYTLVSPQLYNTKFWFLPQNRERYFLLGIRNDLKKTFVFPEQQKEFIPKLSSILESNVDEKFYISDEKAAKIIEQAMERIGIKDVHACITPDRLERRQQGRRAKENEEEMFTLTSQDLHGVIQRAGEINVLGLLDMKGHDILKRVYDTEGISPTLNTCGGGNLQPKILEQQGLIYSDNKVELPIPTMEDGSFYTITTRTHCQPVLHGIDRKQGHFVFELAPKYRVRKLTPREYARLQGFPDSYEQVVSNSQFYKQMGNAVSVTVAYAIAKAIKEQM